MSNLNLQRIKAIRLSYRFLGVIAGALFLFAMTTGFSSAEAPLRGHFRGDAYGTHAYTQLGPLTAEFGKSAWITCTCQGTNGETQVNQVATLDTPLNGVRILKTGTIYNTAMAKNDGSLAVVQNTARIEGLSLFEHKKLALLGGLITADAVKAVANTTANASTISSNSNGSGFVKLRIGLTPMADNVAPNTTVELRTLTLKVFGKAVLRETKTGGDGLKAGTLTVNMIHVTITADNPLKLPIGAEIIVGHASSGFVRTPIQVTFSGYAFVENIVTADPLLLAQLGRISPVYVDCTGTNGKTDTNSITLLQVQSLVNTGVGKTTAKTTLAATKATAETTTSLSNINLLNGLITADALKGVATTTLEGTTATSSTAGSTFVNLKLAGVAIAADFKGDKKLTVGGVVIGKVVFRETPALGGANTMLVMLHIYITKPNNLLPVGTEIELGVANSGIKPF